MMQPSSEIAKIVNIRFKGNHVANNDVYHLKYAWICTDVYAGKEREQKQLTTSTNALDSARNDEPSHALCGTTQRWSDLHILIKA